MNLSFLVVSPLGLRKYRRPDGCHTTIHLPGNTKKSDSNRWFDGLGLDVKKGKLGKLLHDDLRHSMALQQNVSCAAKRKLGMVTQNEGSASSRSKSHTVCVYIYMYQYIHTIYVVWWYMYIYIHTRYIVGFEGLSFWSRLRYRPHPSLSNSCSILSV